MVEQYINQYDVSGIIDKYCNESISKDQLEVIDNKIIYILNKVYKKVEGPQQGVPYLIQKIQSYLKLRYWISKVKIIQEQQSNMKVMKKKVNEVDITTTLEEVKDELKKAESKWKDVIIKGIKHHKKELLDRYNLIIEGDDV